MRYALINPQGQIDRIRSDVDPTVATKAGWRWLPCPVVAPPAHDPLTEVVTGPTYEVGETSVTEVWIKRNLTAQELSDRKDAVVDALARQELIFKVLFDQEKRLRVLEGKPAITAAQYRAALKAAI